MELLCVSDVHFPKGFRKYVHLIVGALGVPLSECVYMSKVATLFTNCFIVLKSREFTEEDYL